MRAPIRTSTLAGLLALAVVAGACSTSDDASSRSTTTEAATTEPATTAPASTAVPTLTEGTTIGGDRPVEVVVPAGYDPTVPAPVLLLLHGYGVDGTIQNAYLRLGPAADAAGMLLVHPDGTEDARGNRYWNATDACCAPDEGAPDDVAYLTGLLDEVAERYNVDPKRVYLVGHSNGGFMSFRMACDVADRIAAIATIAGATFDDPAGCRPSEPVAVLAIHGEEDETIRFDGGTNGGDRYPSADQTAAAWADANGCSAEARPLPEGRTIVVDVPEAEVSVHDDCDPGGWVERWTQPEGVHIPAFTDDIGEQLIEFLEAHPKP